jgi:hemolysin activation/secretion protein
LAAALSVLACGAGTAQAQSRVVESAIVEQSSIIERFSPPPVKGSASLRVSALSDRIPPALAAQRSFVLRTIRIEGATQLPVDALQPQWASLLGREISVAELFQLTARIEQQYRGAGLLALATVPDQDLADGDVRIVVFDQSYIATVETRSDDPALRRRLDPYIGQLVAMQPLRVKRVERILLLMSDIAGMNIEGVLRRPDDPANGGSMTLEIAFDRRVARVALDNRGTEEVGPIQAFATYQENDLLGLFESTTVSAATIPNQPRELLFGQFAQDFPLGRDGLHLGYQIDMADSRPGGELDSLDLAVTSVTGEAYAVYPILRTIDHSAFGRIGLQARNADVDIGGQTATRDRYRWLGLGIDSEHDTGIGPLTLQTGFLQGLDAFGATGHGAPLASRGAADPDFRVVTAGADLSVDLSDRVTVVGRARGQYAFGPLPTVVQMDFGGTPFGRAFDSGAISGDSGLAGSLEASVDVDLPVDFVRGSTAYGFVDYGALWFCGDDHTGERATLGSTGIGFRALLEQGFAVDATLAVPIDYDDDVKDTGARVFLSVMKRF